ncbi:hypothetical protein JTB14_013652 [Gonioctena quinquepunctata]|nr:hypothetical protein JTB14_013652 [Gonioctena quinquepunctata]
MLMMERLITNSHEVQEKEKSSQSEPQVFRRCAKRKLDDSRDAEMCEKSDDEDLNVDVENDDALCPVDLTRRQEGFSFDGFNKTDSSSDFNSFKDDVKRAESVCSDRSRSRSPRDPSPSVVIHQNRRLAFSVENILDPNKFTGRQSVYSEGICCWKPLDASPEYDGSDTGECVYRV